MPIQFIENHLPNTVPIKTTPGAAAYMIVASDGSNYVSKSALLSAGKVPAPGLDPGGRPKSTAFSGYTALNAAHTGFWLALDQDTQPADDTKSVYVQPGQTYTKVGPWRNVWIKAVGATDIVDISIGH